MKREVISLIPRNEPFNATDLIEKVILKNGRVVSYTFLGYWLDIGRHEDYKRAQDYKKHTSL
jgi:NDP-sugar pyrophosphorylase family protein